MALQDVFDPAVEPLDHAIFLWLHWWRETMLDGEIGAKLVELMLSRGRALAQAKQPVGESFGRGRAAEGRARLFPAGLGTARGADVARCGQ